LIHRVNNFSFKKVMKYVVTNLFSEVGFEVLTAVSMKMDVFWVVAPCSLVEVYRRFESTPHRPDDGGK
jgi:hypothetical protein